MKIEYRLPRAAARCATTEIIVPEPTIGPRPPRISCLLALALRLEQLVQSGAVRDYAEMARLGGVSRARVSQILNLLRLAPDIQEHLLSLSPRSREDEPITEHDLRAVVREPRWDRQREMFAQIFRP